MNVTRVSTAVVRAITCVAALVFASQASALGPFSHTIPLNIPKGVNGMQPELSLVYAPDAGNGMLGVGWQLAGISQITRVNNGNGIHYTGGDSYSHSEEGVLVRQGDGSYRSKRDHLVKFVPSGVCWDGPCSWVAYYPTGLQRFYGTTADSQLPAWSGDSPAPCVAWGLAQVQDLFGNYYQVTYSSKNDGNLYPGTIKYTMSSSLSSTTSRVVTFGYEPRPDGDGGFYQGVPRVFTQRLSGISIDAGAKHLRKYVLTYGEQGAATGRSHLTSFQGLGSDGTSGVAQTFKWQQGATTLSGTTPVHKTFGSSDQVNPLDMVLTGDFDGDGRTDVVHVGVMGVGALHASAYIYARLGTETSAFGTRTFKVAGGLPASEGGGEQVRIAGGAPITADTLATWPTMGTFVAGDFDGDGKTDIAYIYNNGNYVAIDVCSLSGALTTGFTCSTWSGGSAGTTTPWSSSGAPNWQDYGTFITGDFNGDGILDIAYVYTTYSSGTAYIAIDVYRSTGPGKTFIRETWLQKGDKWFKNDNFNIGAGTILAGDFTGDGKTDIAYVYTPNAYGAGGLVNIDVYASTGSAFAYNPLFGQGSSHWLGGVGAPYSVTSDPWVGTRISGLQWPLASTFVLGDFDGDGKADIAHVYHDANNNMSVVTYQSSGTGFYVNHIDAGGTIIPWVGDANWRLCSDVFTGDFNGDGKTDIAYAYNTTCAGNGAPGTPLTDGPINVKGLLFRDSTSLLATVDLIPPATQKPLWDISARWVVGDFNGDGKQDIGYEYTPGAGSEHDLFLSDSVIPDLMTRVDNGLGGSVRIAYQSSLQLPGTVTPGSSNPDGMALTGSYSLPTRVTTTDGRGGSYSVDYSYADLRWLPGPISLQRMLGYSSMTATDEGTGQSTVTKYYTSPGLEGLINEVQVVDAGSKISRREQHFYNLVHPTTNSAGIQTEYVQEYQTTVQDCSFGAACLNSATTYSQFDEYFLPKLRADTADHLPELDVITTYTHDPANWILGRINEVQTLSNGVVLSDVSYVWSNNVVQYRKVWLDKPTPVWLTTSMTYYPTGMLKSVSPPAVTDPTTGAQIVTTTTTVYDPDFQAYPATVTTTTTSGNTKAQQISRLYTADGLVYQFTDANNNTTTTLYDVFGRKWKETRPDGGLSTFSYNNYGAVGSLYDENGNIINAPSSFQGNTTTTLVDDRSVARTEYFDGTGFVYHVETQGSILGVPNSKIVCVDYMKDAQGRPWAASVPSYASTTCPTPVAPGANTSGWATTAYDGSGRIQTVVAADRVTSVTYDYLADSDGAYVKSTDANGNITKKYFDARHRATRVVDASTQVTTYSPDPLGRVTSVTLPNNTVVSTSYDSLGRRISQADPQLLGKQIGYQYDGLDRVVAKLPAEDAVGTTYRYDEDGVANGVGRVTSVTDASGTTGLGYDVAGRVVSRVRVISGTTYTESLKYDLGGRLTHATYPDGSCVDYSYDNLGRLYQLSLNGAPLATWTDYDAAGRPKSVSYANNVVTGYEYDVMERLKNVTTQNGTAVLQSLSYSWDMRPGANTGGYNVGAITDNRAIRAVNGVSTDEGVTYAYDNLYRVVDAKSSNAWGEKNYLYDATGNVSPFGGVTNRTLTYRGDQLVAGTGLSNVAYDSAGNMTQKTLDGVVWNYSWTGENLLASVSKNGGTAATMTYDFQGQRVTKVYKALDGSTITTIYIGPEFEVTNYTNGTPSRYTLHLFAHGQRVVSLTRSGPVQIAFLDANRWRSDLAAASMYDARSLRGATMKAVYLLRAAASYTGGLRWVVPCVLLVFVFGVLTVFVMSLVQRRRLRSGYSWQLRLASVSIVITFAMTGCGGRDEMEGLRRFQSHANYLIGSDTTSGPPLGTYFYHASQVGSSAVVTDANGSEVTRLAYLPFGEVSLSNSTGADTVVSKFTGQQLDEETGLYYYGARYYDPAIGRFISADSLIPDMWDAQSWNAYSYARDNPVRFVDPSGHDFEDYYQEIYYQYNPSDYGWLDFSMYGGSGPNGYSGGSSGATSGEWSYSWNPGNGGGVKSPPPPPPVPNFPTPPWHSAAPGVGPGPSEARGPQGPLAQTMPTGAYLAGAHVGLMAASLIPAVGQIAAVLDAALYVAQGNYVQAGISALGVLVPVAAIAAAGRMGLFALRAEGVAVTAVRAAELRAAMGASQRYITMAAGVAEGSNGARSVIVGTSEAAGYLRPGVSLLAGETMAEGLAGVHAEMDILSHANSNGLRLLEVGATRGVCPDCAARLLEAGVVITTPLK